MVVSPIGKSRTTPQSRSDAPALRDSGLHASRESDISPGFRSSSGADLAKCDRWGAFRKLRLPHRSHLALLCAAGRSRRSASTRTGIPASPPSQTAPGLPKPLRRSSPPRFRLHASRETDISPGFRSSSGCRSCEVFFGGAPFASSGFPTDHTSRPSVPQESPLDRPLRGQGFRLRLHPRPLRAFPPRTSPPTQRTPSAMRLRRSAPSRSQAHSPWLRLPLASGPEFHSQGSRLRASVTPPASPSVAQEALCRAPLVPSQSKFSFFGAVRYAA